MAWQTNQANQGLTYSINNMLQSGADPNTVSDAYANYADLIARTASADSEMRWNKVNAVSNAVDQLARVKQTEFLYNKDAPYKDIAQLASAKQQAGLQEFQNGLGTLSAIGIQMMQNPYKPTPTTPDAGPPAASPATITPVTTAPPSVLNSTITPTQQMLPTQWNFNTWQKPKPLPQPMPGY
jgi:hypothetical protein